MKNSDKINSGRFRQYFVHDFLRNFKKAGLATLLCGLFPVLMMIGAFCMLAWTDDWEIDMAFRSFSATIVSVLYFLFLPISCYGELTDKRKGSGFLMLPVSHTEKYVCMMLNIMIIFPAIFAVLYLGSDALCNLVFPSKLDGPLAAEFAGGLKDGAFHIVPVTFFLPAMVSAAGMCGALLFKKRKASKTFLTCAISFIVLCTIVLAIAENDNTPSCIDDMNDNMALTAWYIFQSLCALVMMAWTFFKTKKIEL